MKISRLGSTLTSLALLLPAGWLPLAVTAEESAKPAAASSTVSAPTIHNVLREPRVQPAAEEPAATGSSRRTARPTVETSAADEGPSFGGPSLSGPSLGGPVAAKPESAVAKEVTTDDGELKPTVAPVAKPIDVADDKTHKNVLRGNTEEKAPATLSAPSSVPTTVKTPPPQTIAIDDDSSAPTGKPINPPPETKSAETTAAEIQKTEPVVTKSATTVSPLSETPKQVTAKPATSAPMTTPTHSGRTAIISDSPAQTGSARPNTLLNDSEGIGTRAAVGKAPVDANSRKLFESNPQKLTPEMEMLRKRVQTTLATFYHNWTLNTTEHSPWEVMHAIIAYGVDTRLRHNGGNTTAIGHLCFSGIANKLPILTLRNNELYVLRGPGVQGHSGQFLAILAQSHLQRDYPLYVAGEKYTLEDLIKAEQKDCESGTELTFKLIGLMHYLPSDAKWTNFQGQEWSIDRLVREEIVQPIRGAACGGTHRLMGLSYAVAKREQRGQPITGIYAEADKYIDQYHKYTLGLQNPDGSFSTSWFVRREARIDLDRRLQTTGHVLEWLCFSMTDEQLRDPRIVRSVKYVTDLLLDESEHQWQVGHLGHALHALQLYNERIFGGPMRSYEGLVLRRTIKTAQNSGAVEHDGSTRLPFLR